MKKKKDKAHRDAMVYTSENNSSIVNNFDWEQLKTSLREDVIQSRPRYLGLLWIKSSLFSCLYKHEKHAVVRRDGKDTATMKKYVIILDRKDSE